MTFEIKECRSCRSLELEPIFKMGNLAINDFPDSPTVEVEEAPQNLYICKHCKLVQLKHTVNADRLFKTFWYRSGITRTMRDALADVVKSVQNRVELSSVDAVLDIGCNDGTLLENYPRWVNRIGVDPAENIECNDKSIYRIKDYFSAGTVPVKQLKVITAIAMFYDLDDPNLFLSQVAQLLHPEGIFVVQMNYLPTMLKNNAVDNISHEHLCYYTVASFRRLIERHGLYISGASVNDVNGGSVRIFCSKNKETRLTDIENEYECGNIQEEFEQFKERIGRYQHALANFLLDAVKIQFKKLYLCGASTRGNTTIQYLLPKYSKSLFIAAGERDERKFGRYTVKPRIPIVSEEEARSKADMMLVLPYHFFKEICERERDFLARGGELLFPLPIPKIVSSQGERFV